ncbi:Ig-like domain repeat protein [Streptomyces sp. VRA16 Mangrove soil]|nr:Ig-like domain repeat protein [Streptomyces sp. VRA16 Mangrove soil]
MLGAAGLVGVTAPAASAATPADVAVRLQMSSFGSMVVDSEHQRVFVADNWTENSTYSGNILVYDFEGRRIGLINNYFTTSGMALSADSSTLYVADVSTVTSYDTQTLKSTATTYVDSGRRCSRAAAFSGGSLWYTYAPDAYEGSCATYTRNLVSVRGGSVAGGGWTGAGPLSLEAVPQAPNKLVVAQSLNAAASNPYLTVIDTTDGSSVRGPERRFAAADGSGALNTKDTALSPDGTKVAVADANYPGGTRLLNADDLSDAATGYQALPDGAKSTAVAFSGDGKYIARGAAASGSTPDLLIQPADPDQGGTPLEFAFEGDLDGNSVVPEGLAWSADGSRLFAVTTDGVYGRWLHIVTPPAEQYDSRFGTGLTQSPSAAVVGEPLGLRGKLEFDGTAPATPGQVTAVRKDADGTTELAPVKVAADGSFTVLDVPDRVGEATYTVSYLGDLTHRPATDITKTVQVGKAGSKITLSAPAEASKEAGVEITGTFEAGGPALSAGTSLKVRRTDRLGTGELTSVTVGADGTFRIKDLPRTTKTVTYEVSWAGDDLHEGATASAAVIVGR